MSAATPVSTSAPRSAFVHLITDPWILISWPLLIGTGMISALIQLNHPTPPSVFNVVASFLGTGYIFWSMYFGLAACWRFAVGRLSGIASMWIGVGCISLISFGWMFFLLAIFYSWLGGGIYQFARRWWLLAHGQQPPFMTARRQVLYR
jgi:hypothetical protein